MEPEKGPPAAARRLGLRSRRHQRRRQHPRTSQTVPFAGSATRSSTETTVTSEVATQNTAPINESSSLSNNSITKTNQPSASGDQTGLSISPNQSAPTEPVPTKLVQETPSTRTHECPTSGQAQALVLIQGSNNFHTSLNQPVHPLTCSNLDSLNTNASSIQATPSVDAVRVLFRGQRSGPPQPGTTRNNLISNSSSSIHNSASNSNLLAPIVSANRRLIERQIEAIQEADSRRWNFDFSNCRPLMQTGHRYVQFTQSSMRNCRPLNDQNQSATARFENHHQQQCRSSASDNQSRTENPGKQDDV